MKKLLKIAIVAIGVLVLLFVGLTIFVKSYLSSDRLNHSFFQRWKRQQEERSI